MKDIINIILVEFYKELPIFYIMEKIGDNYKIRESTGEEVLDKLNQYSNWRVEEYFRTAAELSAKKKFI